MRSTSWFACACCSIMALAAISMASADTPPATDASTVIAKQGSTTVTLGDVDAFAQRMSAGDRPVFFNNPKRLEALITNLLLQKQLAAEARTAGLDKDASVKAQIDLAADDVLAKARVQALRDNAKLPDFSALAKEEYIAHKEKYVTPGKLEVKAVLISTKQHSDEEAKTIAQTVEKEAKAHPDQFEALVEKYSDEPNKSETHGLMRDVRNNRAVPSLAEAANALKVPGEISPVVKTKYGYHVLQLVARTSDVQQPFDDVRAGIVEQLRSTFLEKAVSKHTDELRNQHVDANPELVASLRDRFGTAPTPPEADVPKQ
jgi:parvulin-like peptidyl-prolyl isomerase